MLDSPPIASELDLALRESVGGIARGFGPHYFQQQVDEKLAMRELWEALGEKGFLGAHLPERYGGGGTPPETTIDSGPSSQLATGDTLDASGSIKRHDEQKCIRRQRVWVWIPNVIEPFGLLGPVDRRPQ